MDCRLDIGVYMQVKIIIIFCICLQLPDLCSYREFASRYCVPIFNAFTRRFEDDGHQREEELHLLLTQTILIRRLKKDVLKELPPKVRCVDIFGCIGTS